MNSLHFNESSIKKEIKSLDPSKGPGPDGIPPLFLINTVDTICVPIYITFNKCIGEGVFPKIWKTANITPVHKSGSKHDIEQYRPISILCILSKLFERLVHSAIYPHLHSAILPQQHGFIKRRSTTTNLIAFTTYLFESMDRREQVDAIYTDFQKAFDKVDHELLLAKIAFNGIRGNLLRWFASYITNRCQKIVIHGFESDTVRVTSGIPQGSILGPLLFVLFINDIQNCFHHSNFVLYADDLKIYKIIKSDMDCQLLQNDLARFSEYCTANKLHLNLKKCHKISFTKNKKKFNYKYSLNNVTLTEVCELKDLGVTLDTKLHLDKHIEIIINKAFQLLGFVMRSSKEFRHSKTFTTLYKSLIRPQLEYAVVVWDPYYDKYKQQIERVQRKFLRAVHFRCHRQKLSYSELLKTYNMSTLESRRLLLQGIILHGLCNNTLDCIELTGKLCYNVPRLTHLRDSRARCVFATLKCRTNAGKRSPMRRLVDNYNKYFSSIDIFQLSTPIFKKSIIDLLN